MAKCNKCHRRLTDPFSIQIGFGPECRGKMKKQGWGFPKPHYRVNKGRVVFLGMTGKVAPPAPTGDVAKRKKKVKHVDG